MRLSAFLLSSSLIFLLPAFAEAQVIGFICEGNGCRACDLVELIQRVVTFLILMSGVVGALVAVVVGFKAITGGGSGAGLVAEAATSFFIGLVIMLTAWLIIDTGLKVLIKDPNFGPWNDIVCIPNPDIKRGPAWDPGGTGATSTTTPGGTYTGTVGGGTGTGAQCHPDNTACSVDALKAVGYTDKQANVMSCIAMTESTGNPNAVNPKGGACGTFQVLPGHWNNNPTVRRNGCNLASCTDAACNAQAAYGLSQDRIRIGQSPYGDWFCKDCNAKAQGCVNRYDPR